MNANKKPKEKAGEMLFHGYERLIKETDDNGSQTNMGFATNFNIIIFVSIYWVYDIKKLYFF